MNQKTHAAAGTAQRWSLWLGVVIGVVAIGLFARFVVPDPLGDFLGGVFYTVLIAVLVCPLVSLLLRLRMPQRPTLWRIRHWIAAAVALAVSASIEFLQLSSIPEQLGALFPPARLVLGTSFAPLDLVAYCVGALLFGAVGTVSARSPAWVSRD